MRSLAVLAVVLAPSVALAQAPGSVPLQTTEAAEPEAEGIEKNAADDAAAGRAYFTDTAVTAPKGSVSFSLRMPIAPGAEAQIRYSPLDNVEIGVGGIGVAGEDEAVYALHGKVQLWRNQTSAVAVAVSHYRVTDEGPEGDDGFGLTIPTVALSSCLDGAGCGVLLTGSVNALMLGGEDEVPVFAGMSIVAGGKAKFVAELNFGSGDGAGDDKVLFGYAGLRGGNGGFAVDGGLAFAVFDGHDGTAFPFVGLAGRL